MDRHYRECPKDGCPCCLAVFVRGHLFMDEACSLCLTAWHLSKVKKAFRDAVLAHGLQQPRLHKGWSSRRRKAIRHKGAKRHMVWAARRDAARQRSDESGQSWSSSSWQRPNQGYQPQNAPPVLSVVHGGSGEAPPPQHPPSPPEGYEPQAVLPTPVPVTNFTGRPRQRRHQHPSASVDNLPPQSSLPDAFGRPIDRSTWPPDPAAVARRL